MLVVLTAVAGPAVCLIDCWLHDLRAAQIDPHGTHHQHAAVDDTRVPSVDPPGGEHEQHRTDSDGWTPSALTVAIVMLLMLLQPWDSARRLLPRTSRLMFSLAIPPPARPPRCSIRFTSVAAR